MASVTNSCGTAANGGGGGTAWSNPTNVYASDDARATVTVAQGVNAQNVNCTNFGFAVPVGATINGVTALVEGSSDVAPWWSGFYLLGAANDGKNASSLWPTSEGVISAGGGADVWGATLTPAVVNDAAFGLQIQFQGGSGGSTAAIDRVRITVAYTEASPPAGGTPWSPPIFGGRVVI